MTTLKSPHQILYCRVRPNQRYPWEFPYTRDTISSGTIKFQDIVDLINTASEKHKKFEVDSTRIKIFNKEKLYYELLLPTFQKEIPDLNEPVDILADEWIPIDQNQVLEKVEDELRNVQLIYEGLDAKRKVLSTCLGKLVSITNWGLGPSNGNFSGIADKY